MKTCETNPVNEPSPSSTVATRPGDRSARLMGLAEKSFEVVKNKRSDGDGDPIAMAFMPWIPCEFLNGSHINIWFHISGSMTGHKIWFQTFFIFQWPYVYSGWWFQTFFIIPYIGNDHSNWLIFFRWVETTNQLMYILFLLNHVLNQWISNRSQNVCCNMKVSINDINARNPAFFLRNTEDAYVSMETGIARLGDSTDSGIETRWLSNGNLGWLDIYTWDV